MAYQTAAILSISTMEKIAPRRHGDTEGEIEKRELRMEKIEINLHPLLSSVPPCLRGELRACIGVKRDDEG